MKLYYLEKIGFGKLKNRQLFYFTGALEIQAPRIMGHQKLRKQNRGGGTVDV